MVAGLLILQLMGRIGPESCGLSSAVGESYKTAQKGVGANRGASEVSLVELVKKWDQLPPEIQKVIGKLVE